MAEIVREKRRELDEAEHQLQWASRQMMDAWRRMGEEAAASTASAEHRHVYKHNADDTYGICECGKAFKVCPSCGMEIDATGETVDAAPNSHHE